jgi:hypothetical protein
MADDRHDAVTLMDAQPIARRIFANWWMGAAGLGNGNQAVLARCGLGPKFDPRIMTGEQAVALAQWRYPNAGWNAGLPLPPRNRLRGAGAPDARRRRFGRPLGPFEPIPID